MPIHLRKPAFAWEEKNTLQSHPEPRILGLDEATGLGNQSRCGNFSPWPWFCLRVNPRWEREVRRRVIELGYQAYVPLFLNRDLKVPAVRPYIPGYVFASFDPLGLYWPELIRQIGVRPPGLFMIGGTQRPLPLKRGEIERLRAAEHHDTVIDTFIMPPLIEPGQVVEVTDGLLSGRIGFCLESTDKRVRVQFDYVAIEVPRRDVKVSEKCPPIA